MKSPLNRRRFVQLASASLITPWSKISRRNHSPTLEKLRTAHIGVGGMGKSDLNSVASHSKVEVAALCDVDAKILEPALAAHQGAKGFRDYREMIAELGDSIDAVVVSTPDHTHAAAAMTAMLAGKPVYCQKPLTHEVFESRRLKQVAAERQLVTQMGVQIHSAAPYKRAVQMIQSGVIGKVSQVHAWSNKNWGYDGQPYQAVASPPEHLDWNLWLGPAPKREFVPRVYHQGNWRKIVDFGTGTLGDMGVHIFDTPYTALELTAPRWAQTTCRKPTGFGHPEKNIVKYEFPGTRYTTPTLIWNWYDGKYAPPQPAEVGLQSGNPLPAQGSLFIGEKGQLLLPHIGEPVLLPEQQFKDYQRPRVVSENHYHQWIDACLGQGETSMSFELAGPLTEALLLGVVANRFPGQKLQWDAANLKITNNPDAHSLIKRPYREGFEVARLSESLAVPSR